MSNGSNLVPGRECGQCNVCCITPLIDEADLKKIKDEPCPNLSPGCGCNIYENRPSVCRTWYCGWRYLQDLNDEWRPDLSKVLIRINHDEPGGLILEPLDVPHETLTTQSVLTLVASCVVSSVPVFISVFTKKGYCNAKVKLNDNLQKAVESHELSQVQAEMVRAINFGMNVTTDPYPIN